MKKRIEVVAAVIKKDNTYFCAQRKDQGELARKWEFPGGKIEKGETQAEALKREIKEELNTIIEVKDFLITVNHEYNTFNIVMHAYECEVIEGDLDITEHLDKKWLTKEEMAAFDFAAADLPIIDILN